MKVEGDWNWSSPIEVSNIGIQNFLIRGTDPNTYKFLRIETKSNYYNLFVVIEEDTIPYIIENRVGMFADISIPSVSASLKNGESCSFSWDDPESRVLNFTVKPNRPDYENSPYTLNPDLINYQSKFKINSLKKQKYKPKFVKVSIGINGFTKIITFEMSNNLEKLKNSRYDDLLQGE